MKYIDADRLRAEIENLIERYSSIKVKGILQEGYKGGRLIGYEDALNKLDSLQQEQSEYFHKDMVVDAIKLAYGKVSMNPFDCSGAFEELLNKFGYEIH